ncbi:MAG: prepilin-type N-terminal cleavage/methylation domain-containing protein [Candidatus Brocadiales bacterium]
MDVVKRAKKFFGRLRERGGFSLPEIAAVVAITGTLAAVVVPVSIDQIEKGRIAKAKGEVDAINSALQSFFGQTGEWPDRKGTVADQYFILRSGVPEMNNDALEQDEETLNADAQNAGGAADPKVGNTDWGTHGEGTGKIDELVNHLTLDAPGNATTASGDETSSYVEQDVNWEGPYMPQIFNDPWGRNYLVFVRAGTTPSVSVTSGTSTTDQDIYMWIISGGPNETLETDVTSPILNNQPANAAQVSSVQDDIGIMAFKSRETAPGSS